MDAINLRRSVRAFQDKAVEKEKLQSLLEAAMQAPSALNRQPARYIVVENPETRKKLSKMGLFSGPAAKAPLNILVAADCSGILPPAHWQQDCANACMNILHRSVGLGLGGVWLGLAPDASNMEHVSKIFSLPKDIKPFALLALGYPKDENANRFVSRFDPKKIHWEQW